MVSEGAENGAAAPEQRPARAQTVAIIMDGNGRWAASRGQPVAVGHREGTRALRRTVEAAIDEEISALAVYAFSTENWARPADEVAALMEILGETIDEGATRPRRAGRENALLRSPRPCPRAPSRGDGRPRALDRPSRACSTSGSRSTTAVEPRSSTPLGVAWRTGSNRGRSTRRRSHARLNAPDLPEIDLLIRTSGEFRISNFMLWETAYAEFVFTDTLWPDFGARDLRAALDAFVGPRSALRRQMSPVWSRIGVAARAASARARQSSGSAAGGSSRWQPSAG